MSNLTAILAVYIPVPKLRGQGKTFFHMNLKFEIQKTMSFSSKNKSWTTKKTLNYPQNWKVSKWNCKLSGHWKVTAFYFRWKELFGFSWKAILHTLNRTFKKRLFMSIEGRFWTSQGFLWNISRHFWSFVKVVTK